MSLVFVLLDFQHACVRKKSVVYETECRHVAVQRGKQDQNHLEHWNTYKRLYTWYVLKWEASAVFPRQVLSAGGGVPREQVLQQSCTHIGEDTLCPTLRPLLLLSLYSLKKWNLHPMAISSAPSLESFLSWLSHSSQPVHSQSWTSMEKNSFFCNEFCNIILTLD